MAGERKWAERMRRELTTVLGKPNLNIETGRRLPYSLQAYGYTVGGKSNAPVELQGLHYQSYQTDLLISQKRSKSAPWVPRVVIECKFGLVSAHDSITYSAKALAHRQVWPFIRYGLLLGDFDSALPRRLLWHAAEFDFMLTLPGRRLVSADRRRLVRLLRDEVRASQSLEQLMSDHSDVRLLHRRLSAKGPAV